MIPSSERRSVLYRAFEYSQWWSLKYGWLRGLVPKGNREAAAQNFVFHPCKNDLFSYLFGTKNDVLIKVYPCHKTLLTGFEERETIDIPNL